MGGLYLFAGALAVGLLIYLIAVLLNPEKFS
jgi:K+-transporting ATPase KdpF subunit